MGSRADTTRRVFGPAPDARFFGWFSGGGIPFRSEAIQWLTSLSDDGQSIVDKLEIVRPEPVPVKNACLEFDGLADHIDSRTNSPDGSGTFVIDIEAIDQGGYDEFISSNDNINGGPRIIFHNFNKRPYLNTELGSSGVAPVPGGWVSDDIKRVGCVYDYDGVNTTLTTYLPDNDFIEGATYAGKVNTPSSYIRVGCRPKVGMDGGTNFASGKVSFAAVYNRALTEEEIRNAENVTDGLVFRYTVSETTDDYTLATCYDSSGNGNHGVLNTGAGGLESLRSVDDRARPHNMLSGFTEVTS